MNVRISNGLLVIASIALSSAAIAVPTAPAEAVVYCTGPGVPVGCVVRPVAPAARAAVYCTRPGFPVGCVARPVATPGVGAPGVGVAPGVGAGAPGVGVQPANRGGPVNRAGVR